MNRPELSQQLHELCENVYFQPPESKKLVYPCIVYSFVGVDVSRADNAPYVIRREYTVQYITTNPEPELNGVGMVETFLTRFDHIRHNTHFTKDNLYHDTFHLYY